MVEHQDFSFKKVFHVHSLSYRLGEGNCTLVPTSPCCLPSWARTTFFKEVFIHWRKSIVRYWSLLLLKQNTWRSEKVPFLPWTLLSPSSHFLLWTFCWLINEVSGIFKMLLVLNLDLLLQTNMATDLKWLINKIPSYSTILLFLCSSMIVMQTVTHLPERRLSIWYI